MNKDVLSKPLFSLTVGEFLTLTEKEVTPSTIVEVERQSEIYLRSIRQLAEFLGCSIPTAQKLKNSGKIRYRQFGRKCVFAESEILEDLKSLKTKKR